MNKRSAMTIAAGLVAAMLAGAAAFSVGMNGTGSASAAGTKASEPIVRTVRRTITVHKKAKDQAQQRVVVLPAQSSSASVSGAAGDDDQYEGEYEDDGHFESEDHDSYEEEGGDD